MRFFDRIWASIDLDAVNTNVNNIKDSLEDNVKILAVIKANAYGHGAFPIAQELENNSAIYGFAVATAEEAFSLREHGIKKPIIVIGYTFEENYAYLCDGDIQTTVYTKEMIDNLVKVAKEKQTVIHVQIKVDTGMNRIGISPDQEGKEFVRYIQAQKEIRIAGIFTHFANADTKETEKTREQYRKFDRFVSELEEEGIDVSMKHCSNSAGTLNYRDLNKKMDLVRAGIIIYGLWPSDEINRDRVPLKPVLSLYSRVVQVKEIEKGTPISYGSTYVADKQRKIATISAGYGDGYPRNLSSKGYILVHGKKAPILGRICMDQFMVDISEIEKVSIGDSVTLLGEEKDASITFEDLAHWGGGFNYELACNLNLRVPRIFTKKGKEKIILDYLEMQPEARRNLD